MALSALRTAWLFTGVRETPRGAIFYHNKCSDFITSRYFECNTGWLNNTGTPRRQSFIITSYLMLSWFSHLGIPVFAQCYQSGVTICLLDGVQCNVQFSYDLVLNNYKTWFTIVRRYPRENKKFPNLNLWVWHIFQIPHFEFLLFKVLKWITFYSFFQSRWRIVRRWNFGPRRLAWV